jgi:hypothetical protein
MAKGRIMLVVCLCLVLATLAAAAFAQIALKRVGGGQLSLTAGLTGNKQELFGHVTTVEGYALPNFNGCHALVELRDTPGKTIIVYSDQVGLQTLLATALATGNLVDLRCQKYATPPNPLGGAPGYESYYASGVILYAMH